MPEINKNNFSKLCEEKGELLSKELRDQILEQEFMRNSKFPIIYGSEIILQCNPESIRKFIQELDVYKRQVLHKKAWEFR